MTHHQFLLKRGDVIGYDGFKRTTGTKLHVAVDNNGLPISVLLSCANQHDSTKFIDVVENISTHLDDDAIEQIVQCYADKGYDAKYIRMYLRNRDIACCIPYKTNSRNSFLFM